MNGWARVTLMNAQRLPKGLVGALRRLAGGDLQGVDLDLDRLRTQLADSLETLGVRVRPSPRRQVPLWGVGLAIVVGGVASLLLWRSRNRLRSQLRELKEAVPPELGQAVQRGKQAIKERVHEQRPTAEEAPPTVHRTRRTPKSPPTA